MPGVQRKSHRYIFAEPGVGVGECDGLCDCGVLEQDFVDSLSEDGSSFLLGGRAWEVYTIDFPKRRVRVRAAAGGKKPRWGGFSPQFLSYEICQMVREVVLGNTEYAYLHPTAALVLKERREWLQPLLGDERAPVVFDEGQTAWWTHAGGPGRASHHRASG